MAVIDLLKYVSDTDQPVFTAGEQNAPQPFNKAMEESIANSVDKPLIVGLQEDKDQKKQMLIDYHDFIGFNGLYLQPDSGNDQSWTFTETFNYDPIRCSVGSFWIKQEGNTVRYALPKADPYTSAMVNKYIPTLDAPEYLSPVFACDTIRPNFTYKFHPSTNFSKIGVEGFKISNPVTDKPTGMLCKLLNLGKVQYMFFHFDFSDYSEVMKKLLPFNLFYTVKQKQEGYFFTAPGLTGANEHHNLLFNYNDPSEVGAPVGIGSPINSNQAYFVGPQSDENYLINTADAVDGEYKGVSFYFGQDNLVNNIESTIYSDHTIRSQAAISEEAVPFFGSESLQGTLIADVKPVYNYFLSEWEYITPQLPEIFILNAYQAAINDNEEKNDYSSNLAADFKRFANSFIFGCSAAFLEGKKKGYLMFNPHVKKSQNIVIDQNQQLLDVVDDIKTQYPMYNEITFDQIVPGSMSLAMRETGLTTEFIKTLTTYIYGDYQDKTVAGNFTKVAKILGLASILPKVMEGKDMNIVSSVKDPASFDFFEDFEEYTHVQKSASCYDFLSWLQWYLAEIDETPSSDDLRVYDNGQYGKTTLFFGDKKFRINHNVVKNNNSFTKVIKLIQFMNNFASMVEARSRDFHEILSGDDSHFASTDILYYRIEKRHAETNSVIQNFFVLPEELDPDKGYSSKLKVIDTQVKYGVPYNYEIYAVKMVIGTEYRYTLTSHTMTGDDEFFEAAYASHTGPNEYLSPSNTFDAALPKSSAGGKFIRLYPLFTNNATTTDKAVMPIRISYNPTVKIYECPLYKESNVLITDKPPLPPIVNVYPLYGKKDKMIFTFETQTGDRELQPVSIRPIDVSYFNSERYAQKRSVQYPNGGGFIYPTLRFKSDDDSSKYELFRIEGEENMPTKYEDFNTLGKKQRLNKLQPIPEAGIEDTIKVNTKYYYTFRCRDMHNNISNPTDIYCIEMVDVGKGDVYYPIIELKTIEQLKAKAKQSGKLENSMTSKKVKNFVKIKAADQQILLNEEASGITGATAVDKDIVLGVAEKSLWNNKRFKFRFTSRHTGKAIDVNVKFLHKHNAPSETNSEPITQCYDAYDDYDN